MTIASAIDSLARGPIGSGIERVLGTLGLQSVAQKIYNRIHGTIVVRNGQYRLAIGGSRATIEVTNMTEYLRVKSMYEDDVLALLLADIEESDVFYDIGANVGVYSCLVGTIIPDDNIVPFEPHPGNVSKLRGNLSKNGINPQIIDKALSDDEGDVSLAVAVSTHNTSPGHNLIEVNDSIEDYGEDSAETVTTEMVNGDRFIEAKGLPAPTVLKVDVEGAEYNVLRGLEETISRPECRVIYCEVHRNHLEKFAATESELREFLESCGFTLEAINDHGSKYHLKATK